MQNSPVIQRVLDKIGVFLSLSKLSSLIFGLIIFFASTQLGLHFWPLSSLVYGIRIDYLAPTLYLFDLLLLSYLITRRSVIKRTGLIGILVPILLTNLLYSQNPLATLSWSLHLVLCLLFFATLFPRSDPLRKSWPTAKMFSRTSNTNSETGSDLIGTLRLVLPLSLFFQLALAAAQVYLGHSVGGLTYYLGERSVAVGQPAVALATFMDRVVLRAYGTFGHPNVLAGWAVVSLLILVQISRTAIPIVSKQRAVRGSDQLRRSWPTAKMFSRLQNTIGRPGQTLWVPLLFTTLIVFLAQSRAAALALFGFVIPLYFFKSIRTRLIYFAIILIPAYYFLIPGSPPRSDLSSTERLTLQRLSLSVVKNYPVFGTGANASITTYPSVDPQNRLLQPDHNSLTLFLSWFGCFGVLAILYILRSQFENLRIWDLRFVVPLLPPLLLDHYLLTSPQGLFSFIMYFYVIFTYKL